MKPPNKRDPESGLFWLFGLGALILMIAVAVAAGATLDPTCYSGQQPVACAVNR